MVQKYVRTIHHPALLIPLHLKLTCRGLACLSPISPDSHERQKNATKGTAKVGFNSIDYYITTEGRKPSALGVGDCREGSIEVGVGRGGS